MLRGGHGERMQTQGEAKKQRMLGQRGRGQLKRGRQDSCDFSTSCGFGVGREGTTGGSWGNFWRHSRGGRGPDYRVKAKGSRLTRQPMRLRIALGHGVTGVEMEL